MDYESSEVYLLKKLTEMLGISPNNVKNISLRNVVNNSCIIQVLEIDLIGQNTFNSEDLSKINGLRIITPNTIQIDVGEIPL